MELKKIRWFIYKNLFLVKSFYLAFIFVYAFPTLLLEPMSVSLFIGGVTLGVAIALFIEYFQQWKTYRYHNGGDIVWYAVVSGLWAVLSAGRYVVVIFPDAFSLITKQTISFFWYLTVLAFFLIPYFVFRSWKTTDYWVGEFVKDAQAHLASMQLKDDQMAIDTAQRVLHELYAIKNKDSKLNALVPLLKHDNDGVRAWAARFLLQFVDTEKKSVDVFNELAKKEGYMGEAAKIVLTRWGEEKDRTTQIDSLLENTPIIKPKEVAAVGRTALLTAFAFILFVLVPLMGVLFYGERFGQTMWLILGVYYLVGIYLFRRTFNS